MLHRREKNYFELFDSLGSSAKFVTKIFGKKSQHTICDFNTTTLQDPRSKTCGEFCLFFIIQRIFNDDLSFEEVLNESFTDVLEDNEKRVKEFFEEYKR